MQKKNLQFSLDPNVVVDLIYVQLWLIGRTKQNHSLVFQNIISSRQCATCGDRSDPLQISNQKWVENFSKFIWTTLIIIGLYILKDSPPAPKPRQKLISLLQLANTIRKIINLHVSIDLYKHGTTMLLMIVFTL